MNTVREPASKADKGVEIYRFSTDIGSYVDWLSLLILESQT